jgi:hypothetical protein
MTNVEHHPADLPALIVKQKSLTVPTRPSIPSTGHRCKPVMANNMVRALLVHHAPVGFGQPAAGRNAGALMHRI